MGMGMNHGHKKISDQMVENTGNWSDLSGKPKIRSELAYYQKVKILWKGLESWDLGGR